MKPTFYQWCKQFINDNTPLGNLARDYEQDPTFPDSYSYNELYEYLYYDQHASE